MRIWKTYHLFLRRAMVAMAFLLVVVFPTWGQTHLVDSLKNELTKDIPDSSRLYCMLMLYEEIYYEDVEAAEAYLEEAIELSQNFSDGYFYFQSTLAKCRNLLYKNEAIDSIIPMLKEVLVLAEEMEYEDGTAEVMFEMGEAYFSVNNNEQAFFYYKEGLEIYQRLGQPEDAVWYFNPMGTILHARGNRDEAYFYYQKGAEVAEEIQDSIWWALYLNNIAEVHREREEFDEAIMYYNKALEVSITHWDSCLIYTNLGTLYTATRQFTLVEPNLEKAFEIATEYHIIQEIANVHLSWGNYYQIRGFYEKTFEEYSKVEQLIDQFADEIQAEHIHYYWLELYENMAATYEAIDQHEEALALYKKQQKIEDDLYGEEKESLILNLDASYKIEQKEIENELLKIKSEAYEAQIQKTNWGIIAVGLIILLAIGLAYMLFVHNVRNYRYGLKLEAEIKARTHDLVMANAKLERSNSELESFASITSHDLKEPLRTIAGFSSFLAGNLKRENYDNLSTATGFIRMNVLRMFRLIEDILAYSSLEEDSQTEFVPIGEIQAHVCDSIGTLMKEKHAEVIYDMPPGVEQKFMLPSRLKVVFKNLVENGIKYNAKENPKIWVDYHGEGGTHIFSFKDNGIGIDEQYKETIFKMFKRLHTKDEYGGTGVGLAICKKIVENLGGELYLKHSGENGSEFWMELPNIRPESKSRS